MKSVKKQIITFCAFSSLPLRQVHIITEGASVCSGSWRPEGTYQRSLVGRTEMMESARSCWACGLRDGSRVSVHDFWIAVRSLIRQVKSSTGKKVTNRAYRSQRKARNCILRASTTSGERQKRLQRGSKSWNVGGDILGFLRETHHLVSV